MFVCLFVFICRMILHRLKMRFLFMLWFYVTIASASSMNWQPCPELSTALRYPCRCKVEPFGPKSQLGAVSMDCDHVVFQTESPVLPNNAPIISFSQRYCGQQVLPTQVRQEIVTAKFGIIFSFCNWCGFFFSIYRLIRHMQRHNCLYEAWIFPTIQYDVCQTKRFLVLR